MQYQYYKCKILFVFVITHFRQGNSTLVRKTMLFTGCRCNADSSKQFSGEVRQPPPPSPPNNIPHLHRKFFELFPFETDQSREVTSNKRRDETQNPGC